MIWRRIAETVTGRHGYLPAALLISIGVLVLLAAGGNDAGGQAPQLVPADADAARVNAVSTEFDGGDRAPVLLVVTRTDDQPLGETDVAAVAAATDRMRAALPDADGPAPPRWSLPTGARRSGW